MRELVSPTVGFSGRGHLYTEEEIAVVAAVMRETDALTQGRHQVDFERAFAAFSGAEHPFAVATCSAALDLAAMTLQLAPGDEVIAPAHTYVATVLPFARHGARVRWADIDADTRLISAATIAPLLSERTRAIIVVHLYGLTCDMDPILALAHAQGIPVIEDCAQALGACYRGKMVGTMGAFGCYSFHSHKNMTTLGEGGMLTVQSPDLAQAMPGLRHNGHRPFGHDRPHYWTPAMVDVDFPLAGVWPQNHCLGEVQCALGAKLLDRLPAMNALRRQRASRFINALNDFPELSFQAVPVDCQHVWHLLAARYDGAAGRDALLEKLAFEHGVQGVVQYYPLYRYPLFQRAGMGAADCPHTDAYYDRMISLPFQHWITEDALDYMLAALRSALDALRRG